MISGNGVGVELNSASGNVLEGDYIGTDATGNDPVPNVGGVGIAGNSTGNTIGGTSRRGPRRDLRQPLDGMDIVGTGATGNVVEGDYIGTDALGSGAVPNGNDGVYTTGAGNTIGGTGRRGQRDLRQHRSAWGSAARAQLATSSWATTSAPTSAAALTD